MRVPRFFFVGLFLALLAGCGPDALSAGSKAAADSQSFSYLALGDSYTVGEGLPMQENFPHLLVAALEKQGRHVDPPTLIAQTGWTTDNLLDAVSQTNLAPHYHLVTLCIGVNNQFQSQSLADYGVSLDTLLKSAKALAGGEASRVIVISIPDYSLTPTGTQTRGPTAGKEIDAFNSVAHDHALAAGARWVDITPLTRDIKAGDQATDGLHYTAQMHARWVNAILPEALKIIPPAMSAATTKP